MLVRVKRKARIHSKKKKTLRSLKNMFTLFQKSIDTIESNIVKKLDDNLRVQRKILNEHEIRLVDVVKEQVKQLFYAEKAAKVKDPDVLYTELLEIKKAVQKMHKQAVADLCNTAKPTLPAFAARDIQQIGLTEAIESKNLSRDQSKNPCLFDKIQYRQPSENTTAVKSAKPVIGYMSETSVDEQQNLPRFGQDVSIKNDPATKQPTLSRSSISVSDPKHIPDDAGAENGISNFAASFDVDLARKTINLTVSPDKATKNRPGSMTTCNGRALQMPNVGSRGNTVESTLSREADLTSKEITTKLFESSKHNKRMRQPCLNQLIEGSEISQGGLACGTEAEINSTRAEEPRGLQFQTVCFVNDTYIPAIVPKRRSEFVGEVSEKSFYTRPSKIDALEKPAQVQQGELILDEGRRYPSCSTIKIPDAEATSKDKLEEYPTRARTAKQNIKSVINDPDAEVVFISARRKLDSKVSTLEQDNGTLSSPNISLKADQTARLLQTSFTRIVNPSCQAKSGLIYPLTDVTEHKKTSANACNLDGTTDIAREFSLKENIDSKNKTGPANTSTDCLSSLRQNVIESGKEEFLIRDKKRKSHPQSKEAAIRNNEYETMCSTREHPSQLKNLRCRPSAFNAVETGAIEKENVNFFTDNNELKNVTKANPINCTYETRSRNPNKAAEVSSATHKSSQQTKQARRTCIPFSQPDIELLVEGVERLGTGRWRDIKRLYFAKVKHRTSADLKDKWRSLVHSATLPSWQRRGPRLPTTLTGRILAIHKEENNGPALIRKNDLG
ncbi:hypothetical protein O6H91_12G090600 [Diphasiastrum complanatum]|nr:hypothetical protein O6H91_12G090600 [Diphasiastrum complanatum]